jgi:hypothetical protein
MRLTLAFLIMTISFSSLVWGQAFVPETKYKRGSKPRRTTTPKTSPRSPSQPVAQSSASTQKMDAWSFQFGTHTEYFNAVQTDTSGTQRKFDFAPTIGLGMKFSISPEWKFLPEVNWVLPFGASDDNMIKNLFMLRGDVGYELLDWLRLRVGTSLMWLNMHGKGGTTKISNGGGQSTFYNPDENRSALNNTFDLGVEGFFNEAWSARLQTYTYSLFEAERRQYSYTLFLSHYWE